MLGLPMPSKNESSMTCPFCGKKKKMYVNMTKSMFTCFSCGTSGTAASLYGMLKYGYTKEQMRNDKKLFAIMAQEITGTPSSASYIPRKFEEQEENPVASIENRNEAYRRFLGYLTLKDEHRENLLKRGLSEKDILNHGYKSVPTEGCLDIIKKMKKDGIDLTGVPGFYIDDYGMRRAASLNSGFFIPVVDLKKRVQGLQVRFDNPGDGPRYKWFSSGNWSNGTGAKTFTHFVGYPEDIVYLTEGPLKADIINKFMDCPVLAVPGVNATKYLMPMVRQLKEMKVKKIVTAFDMDFLSNDNVKKAYHRLIKMLREEGSMEVVPKMWDARFKGLDDFLLAQSKGEVI